MFYRLLNLAIAPTEATETEMAVGDEGPHAARFGERHRGSVVRLAVLGLEAIGVGRKVAE